MTLEQTRQLGIEFERRVQTMIPETEFVAKLDTETIYSYLNQYQDKLIHEIYRSIDQVPSSNNEKYFEILMQTLLKSDWLDIHTDENGFKYAELPENFGLYINSLSKGSMRQYKGDMKPGLFPNVLLPQNEWDKAVQKPYDSMKILRTPIVKLGEENGLRRRLWALYDKYTTADKILLDYYKVPQYMNILESKPCELPMEMFEQLISGAVDLYVQYVAGAEVRKKQMIEQAKHPQKQNNDER